ncbi:sciellin isoform X2 [Labrus bergylta]|uniref:sciellin isoform X2 n=1 Tax=Labrus bergylta TaxID=56723 RepID=UPI0033137625
MSKYTKPLLKDGSWIRKADDEDELVDDDPNYGKTILSQRPSGGSLSGSLTEEPTTPVKSAPKTSYVESLTKRFGGSQDELNNSTTTTTKVTKDGKTTETTTFTTQKSPGLKSPTKTETFTERVLKASNKGQQFSPFSPPKTTTVTETTVTTNKDAGDKLYDKLPKSIKDDFSLIDSKTSVTTTETVVKSSGGTDAEDKLFDTLIPSSTRSDYSDSKTTISSTETVTVRSSTNGEVKSTTTTKNTSSAEDDLYGTLLPKGITSGLSSPISGSSSSITRREIISVESSRGLESSTLSSPSSTKRTTSYSSYSDDIPSSRTTSYTSSDIYDNDSKSYSYSKPDSSYEYTSISSPTSYSSNTYRSSSRSDDSLTDQIYSNSSKSLYASSDRAVLEKDLCSYCRKPFTGDAKMVLDDMNINCHATCFKCQVCNNTLAHLKAGDSMWVYKQMVHCENCFETTRERWRR